MKAVIQTGYGSADVMKLKDLEKPMPGIVRCSSAYWRPPLPPASCSG